MKKLCFETDQDGFYGTYYENPEGADCAVIGLFGDDPNDYMAKCGAKWLHKNGVNALCMSPGKHNYSLLSWKITCLYAGYGINIPGEKRLNSNFLKVSFWLDFSKKNYRIAIHGFNHDILKNL